MKRSAELPAPTDTGAGRGSSPPLGGQSPPVPAMDPAKAEAYALKLRSFVPIVPPPETIEYAPARPPAPAPPVNRPPVPVPPPTIDRVVNAGGEIPVPQPLDNTARAARCAGRRCPVQGKVIGAGVPAPEPSAGLPGAPGAPGADGAPASALAVVLVAILALVALKG